MNAALDDEPDSERERLFAEIGTLKAERNKLQADLAECRHLLRECQERDA